ncbi:MAG: DUF4097 family beta strand repeat protein [Anaerolineales bacterium]|nr:DUF4097 family beta strand repeat protein [Anaerolineales bacterium]
MKKVLLVVVIIVILLALCAGIVLAGYAGIRALALGSPGVRSIQAEADEEQRLEVSEPVVLDVESDFGKIQLQAGEEGEIVILAHKVGFGATQESAQEAVDNMEVVVTQTAGRVTVRVERPDTVSNWRLVQGGGSVDFSITLPANTNVVASTSSGDVALTGTSGGADLHSDFGDVTLIDVSGTVTASTQSGQVKAQGVQAGEEAIDLSSEFGDVSLETSSAGEVAAWSGSGTVRLEDVEVSGEVTLNSNFGSLTFENGEAGPLDVQTSNGVVTLSDLEINGDLLVRSDFGDISLTRVVADNYDLETNSGSITVDGTQGSLEVVSGFGDIVITNGISVTLNLQSNNGKVSYSGSLGEGPHTVSSEFGNVELYLPADSALDIDLQTGFGVIKTDFLVTMVGELSEKHLVGMVGGGGMQLTASTNSGNVTLEVLP